MMSGVAVAMCSRALGLCADVAGICTMSRIIKHMKSILFASHCAALCAKQEPEPVRFEPTVAYCVCVALQASNEHTGHATRNTNVTERSG